MQKMEKPLGLNVGFSALLLYQVVVPPCCGDAWIVALEVGGAEPYGQAVCLAGVKYCDGGFGYQS